jgi:hypothetical protein
MGVNMFGKIGKVGIKIFTNWRHKTVNEYFSFTGYKVIGCDINDSIIPYAASLKQAITERILE